MQVNHSSGVNLGPAISSIMSFVMRCSVIAYNEFLPPFIREGDKPLSIKQLIGPGRAWAEIWEEILDLKTGAGMVKGLRPYLSGYIPSPEEEQCLIETAGQVYKILMNVDEKIYYSIMGAMRLYQFAHQVARVDLIRCWIG